MFAWCGLRSSLARVSGLRIVFGVKAMALLALATICSGPHTATAKTPGTVHCYGGWCHYINSIGEMDSMVGRRGTLIASYYDDCKRDRFNPCGLTSSGAVFEPNVPDNAASPIFPDGTVLLTYNPITFQAAVVRVTSTGPYRGDRKLDVSRATAEHLGFLKTGVAELQIVVLQSPGEKDARYSRMRVYPKVPGHIGRFETFEAANDAALTLLNMNQATAVPVPVNPRADLDRWIPFGLAESVRESRPEDITLDALPVKLNELGLQVSGIEPGLHEVIVARTLSETTLAQPTLAAAPPSLFARISVFVRSAQANARSKSGSSQVAVMDLVDISADLTFEDKLRAFVRSAQVRARIGVNDQPILGGLIAQISNQSQRLLSKD